MSFASVGAAIHNICVIAGLTLAVLSATSLRAEAPSDGDVVNMIAAGRTHEAHALLLTLDPSAEALMLFEGRVLKADGRFADAIVVFRKILEGEPGYINARRELAHTLLLNHELEASEFHFRELIRSDTDAPLREGYWRFLQVIENARPSGLRTQFALLPSTNVNRGSSRTVFDPGIPNIPPLRITNQGEAGVGVLLGLSGFYRQSLGDQSGWSLDWGLQGRKYRDEIYDSATASLRLGVHHRQNQTHWSFGTFARQIWRKDEDDNVTIGLDAAVERYVSDRHSFFVNAVVEERQYPHSAGSDASFYSSQEGLRFTPAADKQLTFGARFDANRPDTRHQGYDGHALFGRASKSWSGGIKTDIGLEIGSRDYRADFPLTADQRDDDYYRIDATLLTPRWSIYGFTPTTSCAYTRNYSTIAFYDYDVAECQMRFVRRY